MNNLDALDAARGGPFTYRAAGRVIIAPDPATLNYQIVLAALMEEVVPGCPLEVPYWAARSLFERWQAHYDLPDFNQANRLAYVVDHYIDTLTYDLRAHLQVDLGAAWRDRQWNTLLAYIDRLPRWSLYAEAVANDPEHAEMLAKAVEEGEEREEQASEASGPPLSSWTPEVELLQALRNDVRALHYLIPAAAGAPNVKPPAPLPGPKTAIDLARQRAQHKRRMAKHKALVARVLPHKAAESAE